MVHLAIAKMYHIGDDNTFSLFYSTLIFMRLLSSNLGCFPVENALSFLSNYQKQSFRLYVAEHSLSLKLTKKDIY